MPTLYIDLMSQPSRACYILCRSVVLAPGQAGCCALSCHNAHACHPLPAAPPKKQP